ncbi:hypothetical protein BpHYR1_028869 [Brachionus plicatilis]|uniref:Uncharacterized protein n=1 Tax=Brachionus plicatilis TaxID=10195 RepID=A0A3M7T746_BRAPC|nr:hypothetical protein BpHYR1_028869 [Brachionus plicatilis]
MLENVIFDVVIIYKYFRENYFEIIKSGGEDRSNIYRNIFLLQTSPPLIKKKLKKAQKGTFFKFNHFLRFFKNDKKCVFELGILIVGFELKAHLNAWLNLIPTFDLGIHSSLFCTNLIDFRPGEMDAQIHQSEH